MGKVTQSLINKIHCFFKGHSRMRPSGTYTVYIEKGYCLRCNRVLKEMTFDEYVKLRLRGKDGREKSTNGRKKGAIL